MHNRVFTTADQLAFAKLSGDNNPLHMDPIAARRLLFGRPVVHGIHLLLWALDTYIRDTAVPVALRSVRAQFLRPVGVNEGVSFSIAASNNDFVDLQLISAGVLSTKIRFALEAQTVVAEVVLPFAASVLKSPNPMREAEIASYSGDLDLVLDEELSGTLFPHLTKFVPALQIATLLATTRLVGVECPGLNSVYFELDLSSAPVVKENRLHFEVTRYEKALGLVVMRVSAPTLAGAVKAFVRPPIQRQPSYLELKEHIISGEFADQRAVIIGGSRGLGEIAVKLLSGGGANVKFTYHSGQKDADKLRDEVTSSGGQASCLQLDILESDTSSLATEQIADWRPTHLYFFATPFIFASATGVFSPGLFDRFCAYYVRGFVSLISRLAPAGLKYVLYPSSVAIDEVPSNMGEYASAKAAGEMVCAFLRKVHRNLIIECPRLPRLATDQTVSLRPVDNADPVPVILSALRLFPFATLVRETPSVGSHSS